VIDAEHFVAGHLTVPLQILVDRGSGSFILHVVCLCVTFVYCA